jgi:hypothetical protein
VSNGVLTVRTSGATLSYKVGSGPFTPYNTSLVFSDGTATETVHPTWDWECPFGQLCQAGAADLNGGASISQFQIGYESDAGYAGNMVKAGASATWNVLGAPEGPATLSLRYSNVPIPVLSKFVPVGAHTIELWVDGRFVKTLAAAPTSNANPWSTIDTTVTLHAGSNPVELRCAAGDSCNVDLDSLSIGPASLPVPAALQTDPLGGWFRGFDSYTYLPQPPCSSTSTASCPINFEPLHTDGLLDRAGWRLLDDTRSAIWTPQGWVKPRPAGGDLEDGYLFAYGQDYAGALTTFAELTGPAPLLPRDVFGVWYSDYTPYSSNYVENSLYPQFERYGVPLNTLSLDTDWKSPNSWNGWEWNSKLFPDATAFLKWAGSHNIDLTLNIHSSIDDNDPKISDAQHVAGNTLGSSSCTAGPCKVWDWSSVPQAESNFELQQSFQKQGVAFWWLDWCCDDSFVSMPGVTPDSWIGHLYAQEMVNQGERGFLLARIGSSNGDPLEVYAAGPWSDHTSAIAFTGDAWGTWGTLAEEVALTPDEATIGEPYVSDDIGSYLGPPPGSAADPPDLYDRWVQWGTFQPILRLHSNDGDRLPWQYPEPVSSITEDFLRLRESLIPYTYTLSAQAHAYGTPMAQPLYLQYPGQAAAYLYPEEYLYGSDVLVAPVTSPGDVADVTLWIPPGRWVDYFTGATFNGPMTTTVSVPLDRMPVFVRAGGIIPEETPSAGSSATPRHLVLKVFAGSSGSFDLYGDSGTGLGYTKGQYTETSMTDSVGTVSTDSGSVSRVTIGAARGGYPGEPSSVSYQLDLIDLTAPSEVRLNGHRLTSLRFASTGPGWYYDASTATVVVDTPALSTSHSQTVSAQGTTAVQLPEPHLGAS